VNIIFIIIKIAIFIFINGCVRGICVRFRDMGVASRPRSFSLSVAKEGRFRPCFQLERHVSELHRTGTSALGVFFGCGSGGVLASHICYCSTCVDTCTSFHSRDSARAPPVRLDS